MKHSNLKEFGAKIVSYKRSFYLMEMDKIKLNLPVEMRK